MNLENIKWMKRSDFLFFSLWLILGLTLAVISYLFHGVDFRGYYAAARVLLAGGNPYDYRLVARELLLVTGEMGNNPYYYPPWFAWLFVPLTALPFQIARAVWMAFNFVIWNISLWSLGAMFDWPPMGWRRYLLFALTTFSFAWITWRYEQAGILVLVVLVAAVLSIQKEKWASAGVWLALLLIKPNITLLVVLGISLWLIVRRHWKPVSVMIFVLAGLLAVSTWITPDWYQPFFENGFGEGLRVVLDGPDRIVAIRINTTFLDWLAAMKIERGPRTFIYGVAILAGVFVFAWAVFRSRSILQLTAVSLLVSYTLTPYALQYDFPPLAFALFWGLSLCVSASPTALRVGIALAGFVFSVIFWQQNISWAYWMVAGLVVLGVWGLYQEKKTARLEASP